MNVKFRFEIPSDC